jgi:hypothetical protein
MADNKDKYMEQSWGVVDRSADRFNIRSSLLALEGAITEKDSGLVIGFCKSILESISKSILDDNSVEYSSSSSFQWIVKTAIISLGIVSGAENQKKARESFSKLLNSCARQFEVAAQSIGELRNVFCPLSHGKSNVHTPLDLSHALFVAKIADSMVGFIYEVILNREVFEEEKEEIAYQDNEGFNDLINDQHEPAIIYDDAYLPSEILFNLNPGKYRDALMDFKKRLLGNEADE